MPFFDFEDVVDNIVDEFFLDKRDEDGVYDSERLPKNFLKLALVSRNFLRPVRRNLYRDLQIEGTERFLLFTGQLRFSPHLANFVKTASVVSNCMQRNHIDGDIDDGPGWEPRSVSTTALRWFLDACPQLTELTVSGGDFLLALASQAPQNIKLTDITIMGCVRCNQTDLPSCMGDLAAGWLKNVVAFPRLKELDLTEIQIGGPGLDATKGIPSSSSACTGLSISNMNRPTYPHGGKTLLRSMPALAELVLDGLYPMPRGELKNCLNIVAKTLKLLTITDYHSTENGPQPWENDTVAGLHQLNTLCFNGVPVTPPLLDMLPPRLEYLRLSRNALTRLPAPILATWLRREPFPLRGVLKKFEVIGELRRDSVKRGPKASAEQVAELSRLCGTLGIEWIYGPEKFF
ncbi:hypothetical protein MSAN_01051400 [Mycena sanguinolenta]|uniref:Uncharacterized protein n=1 Tax=Mycena sanguinolenta TaxID=230812 RepID=A0A8H6YRN5_9AGAR|nr:hypothetical protein MSAN_01051400 [Mycena sanguinolenta]